MVEIVLRRVIVFFKEIFENDVGVFRSEAKRPSAKWIVYWVAGIILSLVIPTCLVYLEAWQFKWNVFALIWEEGTNYLYRGGYFLSGICANIGFLFLGYFNTYHINGDRQLLSFKKEMRFLVIICYIVFIVFFTCANILY